MIMTLVDISQTQGRIPVTVFQLQDRVNLGNYKELEQTAQQAYDNGMRDLVIDLSQTPSLTSIGIRALVVIHKILMKDSGVPTYDAATKLTYKRLDLNAALALAYARKPGSPQAPDPVGISQTPFAGSPIKVTATGTT
jgi:hypothetical protein